MLPIAVGLALGSLTSCETVAGTTMGPLESEVVPSARRTSLAGKSA